MRKLKKDILIKLIISVVVIFFLIWGIFAVALGDTEFIFDRFFSAAVALIALFLYKKTNQTPATLFFGLFALIIHHLKLYGNFYLGMPFDRIMHFTAGIALALIFYQYLKGLTLEKGMSNKLAVFLIAVFIAAGIASMIEIVEFIGYSALGQGEGILFYGTGDFGEWNNLSWDLICNTMGASVGALISLFFTRKKHKIKIRKRNL